MGITISGGEVMACDGVSLTMAQMCSKCVLSVQCHINRLSIAAVFVFLIDCTAVNSLQHSRTRL